MKVKRAAEHQINKDEYEANLDEPDTETPEGMSRANEDVIKKRKIVKARRSFGGAGSTPIAPPAGRFTGMTANQAAPAQSPEGTPQKANPFANISFAAAPTPSKAAFTFAASAPSAAAPAPSNKSLFGAPPSAVKPKAPINGFGSKPSESKALFSSDNGQRGAAKETLPSFSSPPTSKNGPLNDRLKALNEGLFEWIKAAWENGHIAEDWSKQFQEYEAKVAKIEAEMSENDDEEGEEPSAANTANGGVLASSGSDLAKSTTFSFGASAPAPAKDEIPKFSFGGSSAPAPAPSATSFSFGGASSSTNSTTTPPAGSFSFGSAPAPAATKQSFSFGSIPPPTNAPLSNSKSDDDDPTANPDDGKIEEVEKEKNEQEDILFEARAMPMKFKTSNEWQKYGSGICKLYKHKTTSKHRIVMRNELGRVQFNVSISAGMTFSKEVKNGKKGKTAFIKFTGVEDAVEGPRPITLKVGLQDIDSFHSALSSIKE